ncbi:MAG: O-antigen ligase family protein [Micavibrio sp.]|nr:O-antigen ligase family protein [Micavibrio sp.]
MLPGLFAALGLMLGGKTRVHSNAGLVLAVLSAAGLMASGSRGGLVAAAIAFIIFAVLSWPQVRHHRRCIFAFLIAAAVLAILPGIMPEHNAGERIVRTFTGEEPILWTRPAIWAATWQIIREHVWTGTGIGVLSLLPGGKHRRLLFDGPHGAQRPAAVLGGDGCSGAVIVFMIHHRGMCSNAACPEKYCA